MHDGRTCCNKGISVESLFLEDQNGHEGEIMKGISTTSSGQQQDMNGASIRLDKKSWDGIDSNGAELPKHLLRLACHNPYI